MLKTSKDAHDKISVRALKDIKLSQGLNIFKHIAFSKRKHNNLSKDSFLKQLIDEEFARKLANNFDLKNAPKISEI